MMKVIAAVLVAVGCAILIGLLAFMGVEVSKLTQIGPCMGEASSSLAELGRMPEVLTEKTVEVNKQIMNLSSQTMAVGTKLITDPTNQQLLDEKAELENKTETARSSLLTMKEELCSNGKKLPAKFIGCASDVENNFLFKSFASEGMPSTDMINAFVEKALSTAGCGSSTDNSTDNSTETTEEQAEGGSSGLPGWAACVLALLALLCLVTGCVLCCMGDGGSEDDRDDEEGYGFVGEDDS